MEMAGMDLLASTCGESLHNTSTEARLNWQEVSTTCVSGWVKANSNCNGGVFDPSAYADTDSVRDETSKKLNSIDFTCLVLLTKISAAAVAEYRSGNLRHTTRVAARQAVRVLRLGISHAVLVVFLTHPLAPVHDIRGILALSIIVEASASNRI